MSGQSFAELFGFDPENTDFKPNMAKVDKQEDDFPFLDFSDPAINDLFADPEELSLGDLYDPSEEPNYEPKDFIDDPISELESLSDISDEDEEDSYGPSDQPEEEEEEEDKENMDEEVGDDSDDDNGDADEEFVDVVDNQLVVVKGQKPEQDKTEEAPPAPPAEVPLTVEQKTKNNNDFLSAVTKFDL
ncbi:hypothetical protein [Acinetobacter sp.]|uniref:hypothetical protein n=1 Tax=Acinetobacter sp. TaxID=472 RepID=UPI003CFFFBF2